MMIAILFALLQFAYAEPVISDPKGVLKNLGWPSTPVPFEQALACSQSPVVFLQKTNFCEVTCNRDYCRSLCTPTPVGDQQVNFQTADCTSEKISVFATNGFTMEVTKEDYSASGNTVILSLLKNLGHFVQPEGYVEINNSFPKMIQIIRNGKLEQIMATEISMDYKPFSDSAGLGLRVWILSHESGLHQLAGVSLGHGDRFLSKKGVVLNDF